jgi:diguanylate cyclase (GGDEF)-like protein
VALLPETDAAGVAAIAERMRLAVEALNIANTRGVGGRVTVSVGHAAMLANAGTGTASLIAAADVALYQAKRAGRNRVVAAGVVAAPAAAGG